MNAWLLGRICIVPPPWRDCIGSVFSILCLRGKVEGHLRLIGKVEGRGRLALGLGGINAEGEGVAGHDRSEILVLLRIVATEVLFDDGDGLLVNVVVLVFLKALDVIDAARFVNERDVSGDLVEGFSGLEDGLEGLEGDGNNLGVGRVQDTTKGLDGTKLDEALDVLGSTASTNVGDDPRGLLPDLPLVIVQGIDDGRNETGAVDDGTNLNVSAGGNVGKEPARLLADILAPMAEKLLHHTEDVGVDDRLGLSIATAHEVTEGTQAGCDKIGLIRAKKLNESVGDVGILAGLDALIISVTEIAERPSDVDHDFIGRGGIAEQRCQVGKSRRHHMQIRLGLSTAQVGQRPNDIAKQSRAGRLGDVEQNTLHGARLKNGIAKGWRIARDVAETPGALLADVGIG